MDALKAAFSRSAPGSSSSTSPDDEESGILNQLNVNSTLSWETRLQLFCLFFLTGLLFSMIAFAFFAINIGTFAAFYTIGNISSMGSTMFLLGPWKQLKGIFAPHRLIASILVIVSFVMTLVAAFVVKSVVLALLMVVCQFLALLWYSLSYIPFARDAVSRIVCGLFN